MTMKYDYRSTSKTRLDLQVIDVDGATLRALKRQVRRQNYPTIGVYVRDLVLNWLETDEYQASCEEENRPMPPEQCQHEKTS
jgi:hypothetical protein